MYLVLQAISPSEFYVVCEVDLPKLRRVEKLLADNFPNFKQARFDRLKRGDLVFVLEENTYHRARVEQIVEDRQRKDALVCFEILKREFPLIFLKCMKFDGNINAGVLH